VEAEDVHLLEVFDVKLAALDLLVLGIGLGVDGADVLAGIAGAATTTALQAVVGSGRRGRRGGVGYRGCGGLVLNDVVIRVGLRRALGFAFAFAFVATPIGLRVGSAAARPVDLAMWLLSVKV
jgi:hypothetical protein